MYTVAVLPFYNASNDVEGPRMIREGVYDRMQGRHYSIMSLADTDSILVNRMGITLGSQLDMTSPAQLGEILGVDGVVYGYVLNFDDVTTGVYNVKKVRAGVKLVDTGTGNVIWSGGLGVRAALAGGGVGAEITRLQENGKDGIDDFSTIKGIEDIHGLDRWRTIKTSGQETVGSAAMMAIGEKLLTSAFGVHLKSETDAMLNMVMVNFPLGPGSPRR